ncbi:PRC-barrel domain-containing protein [Chitinispirillales bacterium ANBcel5]|uniref:hypothetical protein n=1 Tax=Cellulosispirillum alkaliphilum TaxID=3039283 RepID=UPI002A569726|nr:PRC-barrel domain-containing protein [Chitinispirillales bacterium ANBcel5]
MMLRKAKELLNFKVEALDGYVGVIKDIYFDDQEWTVRYFVVDISDLLIDRKALIAPISVGEADWDKMILPVTLKKSKILESPEVDTDLPISLQYEIAVRRHYEWPIYWGQVSFLDTADTKTTESEGGELPGDEEVDPALDTEPGIGEFMNEEDEELYMLGMPRESDEDEIREMEFSRAEQESSFSPELRSLVDIFQYRIETGTGENGRMEDLILDVSEWTVRYLAVTSGYGVRGKMTLIPLHWVKSVSWGMSKIFVSVDEEDLAKSPPYDPTIGVSQEYEKKLFDFYDNLKY